MDATPTADQIAQVRANLVALQDLNDHIHDLGQDRILNAFLRLSEPDDTDPGLQILLDIMAAAFTAIGALAGGAGVLVGAAVAAAGSLLGGLVTTWATAPPPSLNGQFASYVDRFGKTTEALDRQLAVYHDDPLTHWNTPFSFNGANITLADLATGPFPTREQNDTEYEKLAAAALLAMDQQLWAQMLVANYYTTFWGTGGPISLDANGQPPASMLQEQADQPALFLYFSSGESAGTAYVSHYSINRGGDSMPGQVLNADSCHYLFQDLIPGQIVNPDGLYSKTDLFTAWAFGSPNIALMGIRHNARSNDPDPLQRG